MDFLGRVIGWIIVTICAPIVGLVSGLIAVVIYNRLVYWEVITRYESATTWIGWLVGGYVALAVFMSAKELADKMDAKKV